MLVTCGHSFVPDLSCLYDYATCLPSSRNPAELQNITCYRWARTSSEQSQGGVTSDVGSEKNILAALLYSACMLTTYTTSLLPLESRDPCLSRTTLFQSDVFIVSWLVVHRM